MLKDEEDYKKREQFEDWIYERKRLWETYSNETG